jgi:hypothetical protein
MKFFFFLFLGTATVLAKLPESEANKIVDAIYVIEGGAKTKYPYGIRSIPIKGDTTEARKNYARKICFNTVQNSHDRWIKAGQKGEFLTSLAIRYCPTENIHTESEKKCNKYWLPNLKKVLGPDIYEQINKM